MCSSGRWKGERELCFVGNRVYLLLAVEVQSQSEQRLLMPFIHFSKPLTLFFFFCSFFLFFSPWLYFFCIHVYLFCLGRESIGRGGAFLLFSHCSKEGGGSIGRVEHFITFFIFIVYFYVYFLWHSFFLSHFLFFLFYFFIFYFQYTKQNE